MTSSDRSASSPRLIDPDPIAVAGLVLGAVAAAAALFQVGERQYERWESRRKNSKTRRSAVLRWEANLVDLEDLIDRVSDFFSSVSKHRNADLMTRPLNPLANPFYLEARELKEYRSLFGKLCTQAKRVSDTTLDLLPEVQDREVAVFLEENLSRMRTFLNGLRQLESLQSNLEQAKDALQLLRKTAEYLRERIVE